jgi:hypothetical protein
MGILPGFNAEASFYSSGGRYQQQFSSDNVAGSETAIQPASSCSGGGGTCTCDHGCHASGTGCGCDEPAPSTTAPSTEPHYRVFE